jgi:putative oligomerization/nucleic acid binding protein
MGMRRRSRRRGLLVGAAAGAAVAHHRGRREDEEAEQQQPVEQTQYAPAPADPADELEHLGQLHASGVLTDEEFASAKAKVLGS